MPQTDHRLEDAYNYCLERVHSHYENFPVASLILPKVLRRPIAVIYAFARSADDFADEGDLIQSERLEKLQCYSDLLCHIHEPYTGDDPIFIALHDVIQQHRLSVRLFQDLLSAFKQDVTTHRYANFTEVLDYCQRSANPVGRLLLHLHNQDSERNLQDSDAICSSLQIINFLQDIAQDYLENNRIYLPMDDLQRFDVTEDQIANRVGDVAFHDLLQYEITQARNLMLQGVGLGQRLTGRFGFQIRLTIAGGLQILKALERQDADLFSRPRLHFGDWLAMLRYAIFKN